MTCYYKDEKATADTLKDGWLYTGDMAKEDEDGFLFLVDRKKDVIISGGENLYPVQIEDFLRGCDAIKDVAVIGLPDKRLGEIATAVVEVKEGYTCTRKIWKNTAGSFLVTNVHTNIFLQKYLRNATARIKSRSFGRCTVVSVWWRCRTKVKIHKGQYETAVNRNVCSSLFLYLKKCFTLVCYHATMLLN